MPFAGIANLPPTISQTSPQVYRSGGGGYSYPPSSEYYVYQNYVGSNGQDVPYRKGNSGFGLIHVINRHDTATSIIQATVEHGQWKPEGNGSKMWLYLAWFYNPNLPAGSPGWAVTIRVVDNPVTIMQDGLSKGIITAYAMNYSAMVPGWIASPNVYDCAWGGAGQAP